MPTFAHRHEPGPGAGPAASARRGRALPAPGGAAGRLPVHTDVPAPRLSHPAGTHEREADRLADQVMRLPSASLPHASSLGSAFPDLRGERVGLDAATDARTREVPAIVRDALSSSGHPLPPAARAALEPRFGHDLGRVRLHADGRAAASAAALGAAAYMVGSDIVFGAGAASLDTTAGRRLLAHELVHVVQQTGGQHRTRAGSLRPPITG